MSISEQVKELREIAEEHGNNPPNPFYKALSEAADTIESLSAKLDAANAGRSKRYYGGGWIYCGDGNNLPKKNGTYRCTVIRDGSAFVTDLVYEDGAWYWYEKASEWEFKDEDEDYSLDVNVFKVVAWRFRPEPYHEP